MLSNFYLLQLQFRDIPEAGGEALNFYTGIYRRKCLKKYSSKNRLVRKAETLGEASSSRVIISLFN